MSTPSSSGDLGGHGKNHVVEEGLLRCDRVKRYTGTMSAKGLFLALKEFPAHIHVLEDMEKLYREGEAQSVLRAACGGTGTAERWVHWEKAGGSREDPFVFEGGIIVISNDDPRGGNRKLGAIASLFAPQEWRRNDLELAAQIRKIAIDGHSTFGFSPAERLEVAEYVVEQMNQRPELISVEIRTYVEHALPACRQAKERRAVGATSWKDVVRAKTEGGPREKPEERIERYRRLAAEAELEGKTPEDRLALWTAKTGMTGHTSFYKYRKGAEESGLLEAMRARVEGREPAE